MVRLYTPRTHIHTRAEIEAEFQQNLRALVPRILHPNNLVLKQINNKPVTCRELLYYFKV